MEIHIYSKNRTYRKFELLKVNRNKRYRYGEFLVEGVRSPNEAADNHWQIRSFLFSKAALSDWAKGMIRGIPTEVNYCLTEDLMRELSGKDDPSGLMAAIGMREDPLERVKLSDVPLLVLFDRPSDKGDPGTVIRSCDAPGADMLIPTGHAAGLYDPDVVVSSMGSFFRLPVVRVSDNRLLVYIHRSIEKAV